MLFVSSHGGFKLQITLRDQGNMQGVLFNYQLGQTLKPAQSLQTLCSGLFFSSQQL